MIFNIQPSDNKKTIYYQSDIVCDCKVTVIENDVIIFTHEIHLEPHIRYYTMWLYGWFDKKIIFEFENQTQTYNLEGLSSIYDSKKMSRYVDEVFLTEKTELCEIMSKHGSDKSERPIHGNLPGHNYTKFYHRIFNEIKNNQLKFFELGMGTNNPNIESNMTTDGLPGASLYGWSEFFKHSEIFGADIDTDILFNTNKIKTFFCDQTNPQMIKQLWEQKQLDFEFDIIVEDGLHEFKANKVFLENSIHKLKEGGYFIIEDVSIDEIYNWCEYFDEFEKKFKNFEIKFIKLFCDHNLYDNNLILVKKKKRKNLVYYTVGIKDEYSELLNLSLEKLDKSNSELYDVLIITTNDFYNKNLSTIKRKNLFFHFIKDVNNSVDMSYSKLKIFDYEFLSNYENVLYVDTDVWINLDLKKLFSSCKNDSCIYVVVEDYDFNNHYRFPFSVTPYTEKDISFFQKNNIHTFNAGTFMFKNSYLIEKHFSNIRTWYEQSEFDKWSEQPYMNQYFNTLNLTNSNIFIPNENFQYIFDGNINEKLNLKDKIIHFIGNTFDGKTKLDYIINYNKRLSEKSSI